jgi:Tfp pilus assembly protein PilF
LTKHPKHLDALNLAGVAAYELQQFERARVLLTRVVEREPARAGAQLNLGTCQQRMGAVEDAIVTFRAVLAQHANADTLSELVGRTPAAPP